MNNIIKFLVRKVPRVWLIRFSYIFSSIVVLFYKGSKVHCPVCGGNFRKFLPYGNQGADNRLCPKCLSLERHRMLWLFFKDKTDFFEKNRNVLHIAPEQTFLKKFRNMKNLNYTTADLESPIADIKLDVTDMPLDDNSYDMVMCNHVMEHIIDEKKAASEIYRVLKSGGFAILQVPLDASRDETYQDNSITDPKEREKVYGQYDHVRLYGLDYPYRIIKHAPFDVEIVDLIAEMPKEQIEKYRLDKTEKIYLFKKS